MEFEFETGGLAVIRIVSECPRKHCHYRKQWSLVGLNRAQGPVQVQECPDFVSDQLGRPLDSIEVGDEVHEGQNQGVFRCLTADH